MQEILFASGGVPCAAWHLCARSRVLTTARGRPCVIMANGFGGTRDSGLVAFAGPFAAAGCDALIFDYRGFRASAGTPRQDVAFRRQRRDYHAAIAAARELPGVDPDRIVLWGTSYSAGHVAAVAAELGLPYACIPAGTRNHFALDLGVDRDDVVGALDALTDGRERVVDLAEINGRVFVNNVSLGLYAEAVQQEGYRDAKLRTLLAVAPTGLAPQPVAPSIRWRGPDGEAGGGAVTLLVSNDVYRLGTVIGSGTRPRLDDGLLGIAAATAVPRHGATPAGLAFRQWTAPDFTVEGDGPVPAGIDGELVTLATPVEFEIQPAALRVRLPRDRPGSRIKQRLDRDTLSALVRLALGGEPRPSADPAV